MLTQPVVVSFQRASLDLVDERLQGIVGRVESPALRAALHHVLAGGKRVRPLLCLLACRAAGGNELSALDAAAALELLHTSSLVHDDIMDHAPMRRGKTTLHALYDIPTAILAGDTLLAVAFRQVCLLTGERGDAVKKIFSETFLSLCEGQGEDLRSTTAGSLSDDMHRTLVEKKTARLLEACTLIGGLHATGDPSILGALGDFGRYLGMAFQAQDDVLDVEGVPSAMGKSASLDAANHRRTFMTLAYPIIDRGSAVREIIREYTDAARSSLEALPDSEAKSLLAGIAAQLMERQS